MKQLSLILCLFSLNLLADDSKKMHVVVSTYYDQVNISTDDSSNTNKGTDSFTITGSQIAFDYFLKGNISLTGKYFTSITSDVQVETQGLAVGIKYYFYNLGYNTNSKIKNVKIESTSAYAPYVSLSYGTEEYQYSLYSVNLKGLSAELGVDYSLDNDFLIRASGFTKSQSDPSSITSTSLGLSLGIGYSF